jgi:hypothetical protein
MDKDLEKILERSKKNDPKPEPPKAPEKVFPKNGPYDYLVFTQVVRFAAFQKFIFLLVVPVIISVGFFFKDLELIPLYILIGYTMLVILYLTINFLRYRFSFLGWQERLPFELKGWNEMIHEKKMFCDLCWNHTRIEVHLKNGAGSETEELVKASLSIFSKKSEKAFYDRDLFKTSKLSRNYWKLTSSKVAEGSANPDVMRHMKNIFQNELTTIAQKTGQIESVQVTLLSEEFEVAIYINSGD